MFTTVLMIEKPLAPEDVEMVTTLHGDEPVSFVVLMQPRGDQDRLLRAVDDVALGYLDDAAREPDVPEGKQAFPLLPNAPWRTPWRYCGRPARRLSARSSSGTRWTCSRRSSSRRARTR